MKGHSNLVERSKKELLFEATDVKTQVCVTGSGSPGDKGVTLWKSCRTGKVEGTNWDLKDKVEVIQDRWRASVV
jgi:hypothetical protein